MAELSTPPPTAKRRRGWRWLGFAAAGIVVLAVLIAVALQTPPARRFVLARVTSLLAAQDITFATEEFRYNPLELSTELRNVRIRSARLPDAPPFIEIDRARVDLSSLQLLRGRYVVQDGSAEGVRVHYFVNEQGIDNLPRPVRDPDQPSQPVDYLIEHLNVPDAVVRYENRAQQIDVTLPRASLLMKGQGLSDRHAITIEAPGGDVRVKDRRAHLDRLALVLDLGREDVKVERAEIEAEGMQLHASGTYGPFDQPVVDFAVQATGDAGRAMELAQVKEAITGQISLDGHIKGPAAALTIDARVRGTDVAIRELEDLDIDTTIAYEMGGDILRVSRLHVAGPVGTIDGSGEIVTAGAAESSLNASVEGLAAEPLMRALQLPYRAAARVDGQVSARWPGLEYARARGDATLFLTPAARAASRSTLPLGGRIDLTGNGERVDAALRDIRAAGVSVNGRIRLRDRSQIDGTLQARGADVRTTVSALEAFLGRPRDSMLPMPVAGAVSADGRIGGTMRAPVVTATVRAPSLSVGDATGIAVDGEIGYRGNTLALNRVDVAWQEARATANGTIGLTGTRPIELAVRADRMQVVGLLGMIEQSAIPVTGVVSAQAQVGGTVSNPIANLHVQAGDLVAYNEVLGTLEADGRLAGRRLDVTRFVLDKPQPGGNGRVSGTGSYQLTRRAYTIDVASQNVQLLTAALPDGRAVTGAVDLLARGSGTVASPAGVVNLRASDLVVGDVVVGAVSADTTLANGLAETVAAADRFGLRASSTIGTSRPYPATINAEISDLDLALLPLKLQTALTGRLRARVAAQGPLSDPRSGRADATVETFAGSWHEQPFTIEEPARFRYADERLTIDQLRLRAQDSTIAVSGNLPLLDRSAPGAITIDANANLATLAQYAPVGSNIAADGRLTVTGTLRGTLEAIDPNLVLTLEDALILSPAIEPGISHLDAHATIANGEGVVDRLSANWGTAQINISARVPLDLLPELPVEIPRRSGPASINARVEGLDPGAIPGAPEGLSGRISFDASIASRRPDIREAQGRIAFRELRLGFNGLTLEQQAPSTIAVANGIASIDTFSLGGSIGTLAATGTVGLTGDRPINVDVDGGLNIAAVALVTDRVRAEGSSTIDISARGTVAEPILSGAISVADGTLVVDEPRIAAESINARVELNQNRATLANLSADVNGGTLTGKGGLAVRGGTIADVDIELAARGFAYDAPLDLRSLSDSDITIRSQGDDIVVAGQVTIQEAGLTGDINFDTGLLATVTARRQLELTPERNPLLERLVFNVNVDTATPILVDNNLAKAEVVTDLRVVGTPYETGLLGRLDIAEGGMVTLNERTFEIERGEMTFIEERRIYPSFDLRLNTSANNYDITLAVTGEPGDTETTLSSSPPLPEPDIMAMLVTGRTLEQ
ncbi:MAG TPA: translocation/assembly module TamB domain-containing protein, partial [Vicinamibacterales bacterium]